MHLKDASVPRRVAKRSQKVEPEQLQSNFAKMSMFVHCIKDIADAELHAMDLRTIRAHWLLALQVEWEAIQLEVGLAELAEARHHRRKLECIQDLLCMNVTGKNAVSWGARA